MCGNLEEKRYDVKVVTFRNWMSRFEESTAGDVLSLDVENCIPVYLFECFYYHRWITWIYFLYNLFDVILFLWEFSRKGL